MISTVQLLAISFQAFRLGSAVMLRVMAPLENGAATWSIACCSVDTVLGISLEQPPSAIPAINTSKIVLMDFTLDVVLLAHCLFHAGCCCRSTSLRATQLASCWPSVLPAPSGTGLGLKVRSGGRNEQSTTSG